MQFRIGVNLGDVIEQADGTIYGNGVNVAAHLESLAEPGGICISASAHEQIAGRLDLVFEDLGDQKVKNIARPVRAYRINPGAEASPPKATPVRSGVQRASIAVLPFENLSGDQEQEYFADGISEDLITTLSNLRWLSVTARNSTFSYKGKSPDIRDVGRELGVRYVLEGSVRKAGERVRITAQLIDANDGKHIWAKRYDRELTDIFEVQDEITTTLAGAIEPELALIERESALRKPAENLDAWDACQRGLWHMWQLNKEDNARAQQLFRQAIEMDPRFGTAYANLCTSHYMDSSLGFVDTPQQSLVLAEQIARQAIAIDNKDAMAHCTLGRILTALGDYSEAIAELRIAIDLNPSFALAYFGYGQCLCYDGQPAEAIPALEKAAQLSPHDPYTGLFEAVAAVAKIQLGQFDEAVRLARSATRRKGTAVWPYAALASAFGNLGRIDDAQRAVDKLLAIKADFSREVFERHWPHMSPSFKKNYYKGLCKAGLKSFCDAVAID